MERARVIQELREFELRRPDWPSLSDGNGRPPLRAARGHDQRTVCTRRGERLSTIGAGAPIRANLPGPSRRIVVEPIEVPEPATVPAEPAVEPADRPDDQPVPA